MPELNTVCILLALAGISWTINYFWKYVHYEITNDAVVDQYIAPLNILASGYIKEVRFTEHQPVHAVLRVIFLILNLFSCLCFFCNSDIDYNCKLIINNKRIKACRRFAVIHSKCKWLAYGQRSVAVQHPAARCLHPAGR